MRPLFLPKMVFFTFLFFLNCSQRPYYPPDSAGNEGIDFPEDAVVVAERPLLESEKFNEKSSERYVQYEAYITVNSPNPDSVHRAILKLVNNFDGYVLKSEKNMTVIRVPSSNFSAAVQEIEILGIIADKEIKGEDVTEKYHDLNIRLESAKKVRDRYLELLKMANSIESALKVEREIERINNEIDVLTGKLNRLKHLVRYSTISVSTAKEVKPGPIGYIFYGVYKAVKWLFVWD